MLERAPARALMRGNFDRQRDLPSTDQGARGGIVDILSFVRNHFRVLALSVMLSIGLAIVYVANTTPAFTATAQLLIDPQRPTQILQDKGILNLTVDNAQVESQVEVLRSERLGALVVNKLGLLDDPEFQSAGPSRVRAFLNSLWPSGNTAATTAVADDDIGLRLAVEELRSRQDVRRVGQSYVINVSFTSGEPRKAAIIANAIVEAYIQDQIQGKAAISRQGGEWLESRLAELRTKLNVASKTAQDFRRTGNILSQSNRDNRDESLEGRAGVTLAELESQEQAYRRMYEALLQRMTENAQQESFPVSDARVNTAATRPLSKSHPKTTLIVALAGIVGVGLGLFAATLLDKFDRKIRTPGQVRRELSLPTLASVPVLEHRARSALWKGGNNAGQVDLGAVHSPYMSAMSEPTSQFADSLRGVRATLDAARKRSELQSIGLLSLSHGEGRSIMASNLAISLAIGGSRTVLVDADLRRPVLSQALTQDPKLGLVQVLRKSASLEDAVLRSYIPGLDVLPLGDTDGTPSLSDIARFNHLQGVLSSLKKSYEFVICDLPAFGKTSDASAISPTLDGNIIVAEWGVTSIDDLKEAVTPFERDQIEVVGVIINKVGKH